MEYGIISSSSTGYLAASVNEAIKHGWIPQGGIYSVPTPGTATFLQAMIRYESPKDPPIAGEGRSSPSDLRDIKDGSR